VNLNLTDFSYAIIAAFQFTNNQYESIVSITGMRRNNMKQTVNVWLKKNKQKSKYG